MYESNVKAVAAEIAAQGDDFFQNSVSRTELAKETRRVLANLETDVARVKAEGAVLFAGAADNSEAAGHKLAAAFNTWRDNPPSTVSIMLVAAEKFGLDADSPNFKAALMTGLAAEVRHDNAYHSTSHFREVTAVLTRLIGINNELASTGTPGTALLDSDDISKCLAAAASHDLMHDGKGNAPGGKHEPYRLENKAIAAAEPFLKLAGVSAPDIEDFRTIIRVTDISANNSPDIPADQKIPSPHRQLRAIYAETYEGGQPAKLQPELEGLRRDPKLLIAASMMSDADLGPSAATDYAFSRKMTSLVAAETPGMPDSDNTLVGFVKFVVDNRFTSQAGTSGSGKALSGIFNEASARVAAQTAALTAAGPAQDDKKPAAPAAAAPTIKPQGARP